MPSTFSRALRVWLAPPETQGGDRRLGLDNFRPEKAEKLATTYRQEKDLESQSSSKNESTPENSLRTLTGESSKGSRVSHTFVQKCRAWNPSKEIVYNAILGISDGMTVPFAVTASLAGVADAKIVMLAGLSELIAGAISMGAGGVLGAKNDV